MPRLSITKNYRDDTSPTEAQLDALKNSIEVFFNNTKLGADNLQDSIITSTLIQDEAVTAVKLDANAVTSAKLGNSIIGTDHIQNDAVTTAKLADSAVTMAKFGALNSVSSSSTSAVLANTGSTFTAVSGYSCTITTNGGPVIVLLQAEGTMSSSNVNSYGVGTYLSVKRDSTPIGTMFMPGASAMFFDAPSAGTYTYQLFAATSNAATISNWRMVVFEPR